MHNCTVDTECGGPDIVVTTSFDNCRTDCSYGDVKAPKCYSSIYYWPWVRHSYPFLILCNIRAIATDMYRVYRFYVGMSILVCCRSCYSCLCSFLHCHPYFVSQFIDFYTCLCYFLKIVFELFRRSLFLLAADIAIELRTFG